VPPHPLHAEVWQQLLGVERVGRHDHFFELGGHSLLVITMIERLRKRGYGVEVATVFAAPTLSQLAERLTGAASALPVPANRIAAE